MLLHNVLCLTSSWCIVQCLSLITLEFSLSLALRLCCSTSPIACPGYCMAIDLCKGYAKTKGPARKIHPENHSFFKKLAPKIRVMLEKCERENGFM